MPFVTCGINFSNVAFSIFYLIKCHFLEIKWNNNFVFPALSHETKFLDVQITPTFMVNEN